MRSLHLTSVGAGALALALAAGAAGSVPGDPHLVLEDASRGRVLYLERVEGGATFTLQYVHSSERVPVRGTFRAESDGTLTVVETAFGGFGPGLPELAPGDDWRIADGMIIHRPRDVSLSELRVRVTAIARQRLTTPSGATLDLAALADPGALIVARIRPDRSHRDQSPPDRSEGGGRSDRDRLSRLRHGPAAPIRGAGGRSGDLP